MAMRDGTIAKVVTMALVMYTFFCNQVEWRTHVYNVFTYVFNVQASNLVGKSETILRMMANNEQENIYILRMTETTTPTQLTTMVS